MKKILSLFAIISFFISSAAFAQMGMMGYAASYGYSTGANATTSGAMDAEEAAGQALAKKLQNKTTDCSALSQSDYQSLGEYYMGLMMGSGHDVMDNYIVSRYGQTYDDQMHIAMGERFSGCNVDVSFPAGITGFNPMMGGFGMMGYLGNGSENYGFQNGQGYSMMNFDSPFRSYSFGWIGILLTIILWLLAIVGAIAIIKWLAGRTRL